MDTIGKTVKDIKKMKKVYLLLIFSLLISCKNDKKQATLSSIYSKQNYSDLLLNQVAIDSFFVANPEPSSIKNEVTKFYKKRNYQYAWFNKKGMTQAVPNFYNQLQNYSSDFDDQSFHIVQLDTLITLIKTDNSKIKVDKNQNKSLELMLTTTFFKYSKKVYGGKVENPHELDWFIPKNKKNYQVVLDSLVISNDNNPSKEPVNQYYIRLKEKLREYRAIQKKGGFPIIVTDKKILEFNQNDSCLVKVKQHLLLTKDLKNNDNTIVFTKELVQAVTNFQKRLGLVENGKIDKKTLFELNKTVDFRINQMMVNMERLRWIPVNMGKQFLLVNIPEFKLHVFESGKPIWSTNIVVGKDAKQTSIFKGNISKIVLNPYWNVPNSIINEEILPKLKRNTSYLSKNNMEVLSGEKVVKASSINWKKYKKNIPFLIRQKPGKDNALGKMKFLFPNNFSIYLHDTPSKNLFNSSKRDFSHGCIRVENPMKLALYFLKNNKEWNQTKIDSIIETNKEYEIPIKPTVPVYIAYFTTWVDDDGNLNFRNDIYDLDAALAKEIFAK